MPIRSVPLRAVAALFLQRQHLDRPHSRALTLGRLTRFAEDVGGIQMDSINVLDRAHYLTVWSRFGPYDRAWLDRVVYRRRRLFEYWAHAACLVPITMLPWWRRAMLDYRTRHTGWSTWLRRNTKVLAEVRSAIGANGPMGGADFEGRRPRGSGGWWRWRPVQHALHYLWMTGALTIDSRRHFHKRYDLFERAFPGLADAAPVSPDEFARWHVERSLHAMGAATERDLAGYMTFPRSMGSARRAALREMLARGEVAEIEVMESPGRWLVLTRDLPALARAGRAALASQGTTFLAPFDSLLWFRERVTRLFGFDYRIEVYTPGPKRVHGYYTLPILHDGHLIGRLDAKAHREARRLEARHVHIEPWAAAPSMDGATRRIDHDALLTGIAGALVSLARFTAGDDITLRRVTPHRLRAPLLRALRTHPTPRTPAPLRASSSSPTND
ncbi:MAG TPA: crosslink repair DNA glycosylase YcaQ family protein [Methylomirabilota bacterium]|jgi:uncharacterized protein YcaQ|nr:crosslink repair DNA glycosylase YcaQ family protein [Methylomirabilota bacterium]